MHDPERYRVVWARDEEDLEGKLNSILYADYRVLSILWRSAHTDTDSEGLSRERQPGFIIILEHE